MLVPPLHTVSQNGSNSIENNTTTTLDSNLRRNLQHTSANNNLHGITALSVPQFMFHNQSPTTNLAAAAPILENLKVAMQGGNFTETGRTEIVAALNVLAKYGILGTNNIENGSTIDESESADVEIPENIVGAILGPNGRKLVEIHNKSGAKVQISPKGVFAPGTKNRIVTISGHRIAIAKAKLLIEQRISEELTERTLKTMK